MPSRFDVERAVTASTLPSLAKLIMLTLATWTDNETAAIPPECRKSLADVEAATGLSHGAVLKHLDILELAGWLTRKRTKGGRNVRTGYRLLIAAAEAPSNVHPLRPRKTGHLVTSKPATKTGHQVTNSSPAETRPETGHLVTSSTEKQVTRRPRKSHSVQVGDTSVGQRNQGTRLPEDWQPSPELLDWADADCPGVDVKDQTDRFTDYWLAKAGAAARHVDWERTWKNWIRRARDELDKRQPPDTIHGQWD